MDLPPPPPTLPPPPQLQSPQVLSPAPAVPPGFGAAGHLMPGRSPNRALTPIGNRGHGAGSLRLPPPPDPKQTRGFSPALPRAQSERLADDEEDSQASSASGSTRSEENNDPEIREGRVRLGTLAEGPSRGLVMPTPQPSSVGGPKPAAPPRSVSPSPARPRRQPKDFKFEKVLGEGAYGTVKLASEVSTGQMFAVKILEKNHIIKEKKIEWVEREKNLLDKLSHPAIITLYYTFQDHHFLYFVLELCPGGEFLDIIRKHSGLSIPCAVHYMAEITSAVEYLHSMGVIHRDLKPENMLLTADNHIKLIDFGTAKEIGTGPSARTTSFCGTAEYLAPEILSSRQDNGYGLLADVWALGCVLYQMLAGRCPFRAKVPLLIFQLIQARNFVYPEGFPEGPPMDLVEQLLNPNEQLRLGAKGYGEIKSHPFFASLTDWNSLQQRTPPPFAPPDTPIVWPPPPPEEKQETPEERQEREAGEARRVKLEEQKRSVWAPFLRDDELIVETGLIHKKKGLFSRRRQLFITDLPRIFYVDPEKMEKKGEIPWSRDIHPEIRNNRQFFIHTPNRTYILDDSNSSSHRWSEAIQRLKRLQAEKDEQEKQRIERENFVRDEL